jgi:deazaflavin-dependent oxidoreductase (nitroreductase family)
MPDVSTHLENAPDVPFEGHPNSRLPRESRELVSASMAEIFERSVEEIHAHNADVIEQFRSNHGEVEGLPDGTRPLLMTVVGAKTGKPRVVPLGCFLIDDTMVVCAGFGGSPRDPAWVFNLRAHPRVRVEVGDDAFDALAEEIPLHRHERLWSAMIAVAGEFPDPRTKTARTIPLFELTRLSS